MKQNPLSKTSLYTLVLTMLLGLVVPTAAYAAGRAAVDGALTVTVPGTSTDVTLTQGQATPAMTFTAVGVGLSGAGSTPEYAHRILLRPSSTIPWTEGGWSPKVSCPSGTAVGSEKLPTATATLSDCGISAVYVNDQLVTGLEVWAEYIAGDASVTVPNTIVLRKSSGNLVSSLNLTGSVRVELDAGAWNLNSSADVTRGWSLNVFSTSAVQGSAYTSIKAVFYDPNGGSGTTGPQTSSTAANLYPGIYFSRCGFTFSGWNTKADGTGTSYNAYQSYSFTSSMTLYAKWTASGTCQTVTFDSNNGTGTMSAQQSSSAALLNSNTFSRSGYTFDGWTTQADGTGDSYANRANFPFTSSVTLYAKWNRNPVTVSFNANGGTGTMTNQSGSATSALNVNSYSKSGFVFSGWNTSADGSGTTYTDGADFPFDSAATLYAVWTAEPAANTSSTTSTTASSEDPARLVLTGSLVGPLGLAGSLVLFLGMTMVAARRMKRK